MEPRISLVTLAADEVDRAVRFYRDVLGWRPGLVTDEVAFFQLGGMVLGLYRKDLFAAELGVDRASMGPGGACVAHNVAAKEEVDAALAAAAHGGGRVLVPARDQPWGGYSGYFADPDGHRWEVAWNPFWALNDDGTVTLPP